MITTTLNVGGMTCGHCASTVAAAVSTADPAVRDVAVDLDRDTVTVRADHAVDVDALAAAIEGAGYEVHR